MTFCRKRPFPFHKQANYVSFAKNTIVPILSENALRLGNETTFHRRSGILQFPFYFKVYDHSAYYGIFR